jgi:Predicted membrane protein (DUF2142)
VSLAASPRSPGTLGSAEHAVAAVSPRSRIFPGDHRVWLVAAAAAVVTTALVGWYLLAPRDLYTGTDSVAPRSIIAQVGAGQRLCAHDIAVPSGTGRVRWFVFGDGRVGFTTIITTSGEQRVGHTRSVGVTRTGTFVDVPISSVNPLGERHRAAVCLIPTGAVEIAGMQASEPHDVKPTLDASPVDARVSLWFLSATGRQRTLISQLPDTMERAALFRPGIVGPWTYVLLFVIVLPALAYSATRLLALAAASRVRHRRMAIWLVTLAFGSAATWALLTPAWQAPDEYDHFAYGQHLAEIGKAPDRVPGRPVWSTQEGLSIEAVRATSVVAAAGTRPPWLQSDEARWEHWNATEHPRRDDGGGQTTSSPHGPPYFAALAPAYLASSGQSPYTQLTAMRLTSALLFALVALFAFLTVRELLPRQPFASAAAGILVAFQPMASFIGGAVNNDTGVNAAAAALVYLLIRGLRRGLTAPVAIAIGGVAVLVPWTKLTGFALYPAVAVALLGMVMRRHDRGGLALAGIAIATTIAARLTTAGVDSFVRRDEPTSAPGAVAAPQVGVLRGFLEQPFSYASYTWQVFLPRLPFMHDRNRQRWPAFDIYVRRGWDAFGWYTIAFPNWVNAIIATIMLACGVLCAAAVWLHRSAVRRRLWEVAVLLVALAGVIFGVEFAYQSPTPREVIAEQGRYAFPALVPLATIAVGACFAFRSRWRVPVAAVLVCSVLSLAIASRLLVLTAFYA